MQIDNSIDKAVQAILNKECVVFPTETVYGLGADATCRESVLKIFALKNRPPDNPLIVHVPDISHIPSISYPLSDLEQQLFETFAPGPLSLILKKKEHIPLEVTGGFDSIGVRIPNHPTALEFLYKVNKPICAPSANISGKPSPTTFKMAEFYMKDKASVILDGGNLTIGIESTVVKIVNQTIYILRSGFITPEMIFQATGLTPILSAEHSHQSPGTRFAHYKPNASVFVFESSDSIPIPNSSHAKLLYLSEKLDKKNFSHKIHFTCVHDYAQNIYHEFFKCDQEEITEIYCELPSDINEGTALRDRLIRASQQ